MYIKCYTIVSMKYTNNTNKQHDDNEEMNEI